MHGDGRVSEKGNSLYNNHKKLKDDYETNAQFQCRPLRSATRGR